MYNTQYYTLRQNFMEKYNKILSKMYKYLVQQIVQQKMQSKLQQKMHNNYVAHLIKRFLFTVSANSLDT